MADSGTLHREQPKFGKTPAKLMHDITISDGAVRQYSHMHWRYGKNKKNFEGLKKVADFLGVSETTVRNRITELERADWVVVVYRGRNEKTGKFQTPFYHVFESQKQCQLFRQNYSPKDGECVNPKPAESRQRKGRKGAGGNAVNLEMGNGRTNSGSDGTSPTQVRADAPNSSSSGRTNSGSYNLDSVYLDSISVSDDTEKNPQPTAKIITGVFGDDSVADDVPDFAALGYPDAEQVEIPPALLGKESPASPNKRKRAERKAAPPKPPLTAAEKEMKAAWYAAVQKVWGYTASLNIAMGQMLQGVAKTKSFAEYNLEEPLTAPQQLLDWADWYRNEKQAGDKPLSMLEDRMKVQSSIGEWRLALVDADQAPVVLRTAEQVLTPEQEWALRIGGYQLSGATL